MRQFHFHSFSLSLLSFVGSYIRTNHNGFNAYIQMEKWPIKYMDSISAIYT